MVVLYYDPHDFSLLHYENMHRILEQTVQSLRAEGRNDSVIFYPNSISVGDFTGEELLSLHKKVTNMLKIIEREIETSE